MDVRWEGVGSAERPLWAAGGAFGALEGCGRNRHAFLLILRFLSALCAAACVHLFFQTVLYTVVCVFFACGSGKKSPLHPLEPSRKKDAPDRNRPMHNIAARHAAVPTALFHVRL